MNNNIDYTHHDSTTSKKMDYIYTENGITKMSYEEYCGYIDLIYNLQKEIHKQVHTSIVQKKQIKNLQQENERLKNHIQLIPYTKVVRERDKYKSRCEKASDKLSFIDEALENDTLNVPLCITKINSALNILQNGSDTSE